MSRQTNNPYAQFLGLSGNLTAPDHFELLGLKRFTSDPILIKKAAAIRNDQLQKWQNNNEMYQQIRRLQMEVATAMTLLVDTQKRVVYDQELQRRAKISDTASNSTTNLDDEPLYKEIRIQEILPDPGQQKTRPVNSSPWWAKDIRVATPLQRAIAFGGIVVIGAISWWLLFPRTKKPTGQNSIASTEVDSSPTRKTKMENPAPKIEQPISSSPPSPKDPGLLDVPFDIRIANVRQQIWAEYLGMEVLESNSRQMNLVLIPPGRFTMGETENRVSVTLSQPFYISQTEVTQGQWYSVMGTRPWQGKPFVKEDRNHPATYVNWIEAMEFCRKLTLQDRRNGVFPSGWKYTLPTEAQWDYACRAGTTARYSFGDAESVLGLYAWFRQTAWDKNEKYAHKVQQKRGNPFRLHDMHGNVWEFCRDSFANRLLGGTDPTITSATTKRVSRGGGFFSSDLDCRTASRGSNTTELGEYYLGFRVTLVSR